MKSKPKSKKVSYIAKIIVFVAMIALGVAIYANRSVISDYLMAFGYEPSSEVASIVDDIRLTDTGRRILMASRPEIQPANNFNASCPSTADTATLGCYYRQQIYIYDVQNSKLAGIKQAVMAHELLHAVWNRLSDDERAKLAPLLQDVYAKNKDKLSSHMDSYNAEEQLDELHSVIGTEIEVANYSPELAKHYNKYFTQQSRIVAYFNQYNSEFVAIKQKKEELVEKIAEKRKQLDIRKEEYKKNYDAYVKDVQEYNKNIKSDRYYYGSAEKADAIREGLLSRRQAIEKEYNDLTQFYDEINILIDEYNQNVIRSNELYDSVDSKENAPETGM